MTLSFINKWHGRPENTVLSRPVLERYEKAKLEAFIRKLAAAFGVVAPELREGRAGYNRLRGREFVFLGFKTPDDHARFEALAPRMHVDEFADVATVVVPGKRALAFRAFWIRP